MSRSGSCDIAYLLYSTWLFNLVISAWLFPAYFRRTIHCIAVRFYIEPNTVWKLPTPPAIEAQSSPGQYIHSCRVKPPLALQSQFGFPTVEQKHNHLSLSGSDSVEVEGHLVCYQVGNRPLLSFSWPWDLIAGLPVSQAVGSYLGRPRAALCTVIKYSCIIARPSWRLAHLPTKHYVPTPPRNRLRPGTCPQLHRGVCLGD
jgi:hypothetical protein